MREPNDEVARFAFQTKSAANEPSSFCLIAMRLFDSAALPASGSPRPAVAPIRKRPLPIGVGVGVEFPLIPSNRQSCLPVAGSRLESTPIPLNTKCESRSGSPTIGTRRGLAQLVTPRPAAFQMSLPDVFSAASTYGSFERSTHTNTRSSVCSRDAEIPWRDSIAPNSSTRLRCQRT